MVTLITTVLALFAPLAPCPTEDSGPWCYFATDDSIVIVGANTTPDHDPEHAQRIVIREAD